MARNSVAANMLMVAFILGGLVFLTRIKQEVFPEFDLDMVTITVPYPGASPSEVERGVTKAIEEGVRGLDGVKTVTSTSSEGMASVLVELELDTNQNKALSDIKAAVDRITSFPEDVEEPQTSLVEFKHEVLSLMVYGDAPEKSLRNLADHIRDDLLQAEDVSRAELASVRAPEISVNVPRENLRAYGLTLEQVAGAIRAANIELPAGGLKTDRGEILLRTKERRDYGQDFQDIVVLSRPDGTRVMLSDIAEVDDSFQDTDQEAQYNGKPAAIVKVFRIGDQTPITVSDAVHRYIEEHEKDLPPGVELAVWNDRSEMYRGRVDLLMRNAYLGLALVLLALGLFLEIRLAFWVTMGIPISFLGALLFLPTWDISINMISLFAFIVTLGIVVDDAIVVGEAIYKRRQEGMPHAKAAVVGAHDVATPVVFSVLTTVVAFSPLLFVPGVMGKFFRNIPIVVIAVLMLSLVESLLVLPAHLSHANPVAVIFRRIFAAIFGPRLGPFGAIHRGQQRFSAFYEQLIQKVFVPIVSRATANRYVAVAIGGAIFFSAVGYVAGGRIDFTFMPKIEVDVVFAQLMMPYGTPAETTKRHMDHMLDAADEALEAGGGKEENVRGIFSQVGMANFGGARVRGGGTSGGHVAEVAVFLKKPEQRTIQPKQFAEAWRNEIGEISGADSLKLTFSSGASAQAPISVQLKHRDVPTLEKAAADLARSLREFSGVKDIDDGVALGKYQIDYKLTEEARSLGITQTDLARQVRSAFFGAEASRQQRGRDEVRVYVRLPEDERTSLHDLDQLLIRTPQGGEIPLAQAATVDWGRAYTEIKREDGSRVITVEADVEEGKTNANKVMSKLRAEALPELMERYPGLSWGLGGQQKQQAESMSALGMGFILALVLMFALMAIPFKSYAQPLIIMVSIPFGFVGALGGHLIMGYDLSILSMMGVVALSGVVVNDSLVLISAINTFREQGMTPMEAVIAGAARRFRPIMLTSLTTFLGLSPMIVETDMQARFLVPMALSLGFGVLFSTFVILLLVPCIYLILEDVKSFFTRVFGRGDHGQPTQVDVRGLPAE
jgi:multidrug efflux pump subunit AcrB